ncbi:hypothetical protein [Nocardioides xinjiangensis]|uniref:hypothetical protein n=1 Tax=Nocardioides xinjiangensis TaxID=2817376 RepID=UPI001B304767|nr:hypothetical protein [Nocardioides sp. SYSU D00514]
MSTRGPEPEILTETPPRGRRRRALAALLAVAVVATGAAFAIDGLDVPLPWSEPGVDPSEDPDGDGLSVATEESGFTTEAGATYRTSGDRADTDGDGLSDGEEAGAVVSTSGDESTYVGISDPGKKDSDSDGVTDGDEYFLGTDPWSVDTDDDDLHDDDELSFGSDPLEANPDEDDYSDAEERERGSAPLAYDESGWRSYVGAGLTALKLGLSAADKYSGGGKVALAAKALKAAKAAGIAAPVLWNALRGWDWSDVDLASLRDEVYADDMDELAETLEGGKNDYVPFVGRRPDGTLAYVGITDDFEQLSAAHGGPMTLSMIGEPEPMPLGQARAVAETVIKILHDRMDGNDLANTRHVIDPAHNLYAPATKWGAYELDRIEFEW